jgi:hypothetical protein
MTTRRNFLFIFFLRKWQIHTLVLDGDLTFRALERLNLLAGIVAEFYATDAVFFVSVPGLRAGSTKSRCGAGGGLDSATRPVITSPLRLRLFMRGPFRAKAGFSTKSPS